MGYTPNTLYEVTTRLTPGVDQFKERANQATMPIVGVRGDLLGSPERDGYALERYWVSEQGG
jgi:hypothetical protein